MTQNKTRKSRLFSAGDVLQGLLQNSRNDLSRQFTRWRLWHFWGDVVGGDIARYTSPVGYLRGNLYVWVDNSVQLQELIFIRKTLVEKINQSLGKNWVRNIHFTLDRKGIPKAAEVNEGLRDYLARPAPSEDEGPPHDR